MSINFKSKLFKIGSWTIISLPKSASAKLPSRGLIMVKGTINGLHFQTTLEPDGKKGHWFNLDQKLRKAARVDADDTVTLVIEPTKEWAEPEMPADLKKALAAAPKAQTTWKDITPMARWEWIRWIRSTKNPETRKKRIKVAFSKLKAGDRRPCCFNSSMCTEPDVSNNGVLLEPGKTK